MPILNSIVHTIDKAGSDAPATLTPAAAAINDSATMSELVAGLNKAYHGKAKAWGRFAEGDEAGDFTPRLSAYLADDQDFVTFSRELAEKITALVDDHLPLGGHLLIAHERQGDTDYLSLALLHMRQGFGLDAEQNVIATSQLNLTQPSLAARINLTQWQDDASPSRQYLSFLRDRGGKKLADDFATLLGAQEGVDASSETRTLLKAFSDYVEQEDLPEEQSREKTDAVIDYASDQASRGEPITLDELSELVDEQQPKAFYDYIRQQDYGLSPEIPPDKRALNQFRRFTGRAGGVSISFDSHLLGSSVEYDADQDRLIIKKVPTGLRDQLQRS
ncbi:MULTISPECIES: nucleoid-associated protein YejK [Halomonadaceae]|uniref:Nucleoid-associated protein n=1 Tax=Onishia taeanensis TaxID=284577 RepID=A0A328Y062_9GAMM|nr:MULTISPECIES: nucleoid-associated protein YejK [Halomonas]RAR61591.1 nucleoid-associated protein [Halomonas taeanensis]